MMPFVHIGSVSLATYGMMMGTGMIVAYYMLRADVRRRELPLNPLVLVVAICVGGFIASKLYLGVENPALFLRHPGLFLNPSGYTFYGAVIGAIGIVILLARTYGVPALSLFDSISAEAALGYGFGRLGCQLAGDGDYGIATSLPWAMSYPHGLVPTLEHVHPTPIYEVIVALFIAAYLWRLGTPAMRRTLRPGMVFAHYLIWTGIARFLVEFIRRNPRVYLELTNAQLVAVGSIALGVALWLSRRTHPIHPSRPRRSAPQSAINPVGAIVHGLDVV
jgi:phosphatidylglycerol---prolipoprotein diacylglyceryl transferase